MMTEEHRERLQAQAQLLAGMVEIIRAIHNEAGYNHYTASAITHAQQAQGMLLCAAKE